MSEQSLEKNSVAPDGRPAPKQPGWHQDFPVDLPQDHYVARRDFARFLVLTSLPFAVGQLWLAAMGWMRSPESSAKKAIAHLDKVPVGGVVQFHYPGTDDPCLLLRPEEHTLVAYSQKCTHLGCAVVPEKEQGRLSCPCHKGSFDLVSGRPLAGPPRRPLPRITLETRDGTIYATGMEVTTV